ncbi:hypothetical protein SUGI_0496120 [Cryptomeria japonica]|nr:hypothetical protein SUGI_0496120 [Cryptomeria japonica]
MGFPRVLLLAVLIILLEQTVYGDFNYPNFTETLNDHFIFNNSNIVYGALQVTAETANPDYPMENKSGRVIYDKAYRFWREDGIAVSFNTTFVLNIQVENGSSGGEGMAFIISSNKNVEDKPEDSHGLWLGLFNSFINGSENNEMVAVEFDTVKNNEVNDPDDNHIGVNVNSINSKNTKSLNRSEINLKSGNDITVWIQFQGDQQKLNVYLANGNLSFPMPSEPLLSDTLNLSTVLRSEVRFGFSASTGENTELNCVKSWSLSIEPVSTDRSALVIILSVVGGILFVAAVVVIVLFTVKYRKSRAEEADIAGTIQNLPGRPREFKEVLPPFVPPFRPPFIWPYPEINGSSSTAIFIVQENGSSMNSFMESPAVRVEESSLT